MTTHTCNTTAMSLTPANAPVSMLERVRLGLAARRQRAVLRDLDDAALADLGLTFSEAQAEAARPVWDVPANWLS